MSPRATAWGAYKGIAAALRDRITSGEWQPGAPLPSESALSAEYRVARNTLRRALEELVGEGIVVVRPGRGRTVAASADAAQTPASPDYRRIAVDLREQIESGELRPGDVLPSESVLADRYGVSRGTARHALAELEGAQLIKAVHGKGRFVRES